MTGKNSILDPLSQALSILLLTVQPDYPRIIPTTGIGGDTGEVERSSLAAYSYQARLVRIVLSCNSCQVDSVPCHGVVYRIVWLVV